MPPKKERSKRASVQFPYTAQMDKELWGRFKQQAKMLRKTTLGYYEEALKEKLERDTPKEQEA